MWTVFLSQKEFALIMQGKTVEKVLEQGLLRITGGDGEWGDLPLVIKFLTVEESGFGVRGKP